MRTGRAGESSRQGGVDVVEVVELLALDLATDEVLDGDRVFEFVGSENGEGVPFFFGAAGSSNAVDVILGVLGDAVVDDVGDTGDVDAAGGDVGGDEDVVAAVFEASEGLHAVLLVDVGVHGDRFGMVGALEHGGDGVGLLAGAGEDHHGLEVGLIEEGKEEFVTLVHGDWVESVGDGGGHFATRDLDFGGVGEAPLGKLLDGGWHGGREEESLTVGGWVGGALALGVSFLGGKLPRAKVDDLADDGEEAHVEHAVDFVEDENLELAETHGAAEKMIDEATGGGDHDVGLGDVLVLLAIADATVEEADVETGVLAVFFELFGDLMGELAGGLEDEDLGFAFLFDAGKGGKSESSGLSGSGLGSSGEVSAFENDRDGLRLDRGGIGVTFFGNSTQDRFGQAEISKRHRGWV